MERLEAFPSLAEGKTENQAAQKYKLSKDFANGRQPARGPRPRGKYEEEDKREGEAYCGAKYREVE